MYHEIPSVLQGVEHALAQQSKTSSAVAHSFDEFEFVHFSLDQSIVLRKRESYYHCCFISYHSSNKALEFADSALFHVAEPIIEPLTRARAKHPSKLLDQLIRLIDFGVERPK